MTDLDLLIEFWETYLELYADRATPLFTGKVEKTIKYLKELRVRKGE